MNPFTWLTAGSTAADKVLDGITRGADALVFTSEEKAAYHNESQKLWLDTQKVLAVETSPRALSRRYIAWSIIGLIVFISVVCVVLLLCGKQKVVQEIVELTKNMWIGEAFVSVIIFYFGNHIAGSIR